MRNLIRESIRRSLFESEKDYSTLFAFLDKGQHKMSNGTVYYVSEVKMNKNIIDAFGNKTENPYYGKLYKH